MVCSVLIFLHKTGSSLPQEGPMMKAKHLIFHDEARDKIRRGVDALAIAMKLTLGQQMDMF